MLQNRNLIKGKQPEHGNLRQIEIQKRKEMQFLGLWECDYLYPEEFGESNYSLGAVANFRCIIKQCEGRILKRWEWPEIKHKEYRERLIILKRYCEENKVFTSNLVCSCCGAEYKIKVKGEYWPTFLVFHVHKTDAE